MKLSSGQQAKVRDMADKMAKAGFKGSKKGRFKNVPAKSQKFAIATSIEKKKGFK